MEWIRVNILVFLSLLALARGTEKTVQEELKGLNRLIRSNLDEQKKYQATVFDHFTDLHEKLGYLEDSQKVMEKKVEDLQAGLDIVQGQVTELQQSSNSDDMLQVFSENLKYERDLQTDFWNTTTCHLKDIAELQKNVSTELQEGQTLIKELILCEPPGQVIHPFGCVIPLEDGKTWSEAQEYCKRLGNTLLEGISSQRELHELHTHFHTFFLGDYPSPGSVIYESPVWLGMKNLTWMEGGEPAPPSSSSLWFPSYPSEPGPGQDCGIAVFSSDGRYHLTTDLCSYYRPFLCQNRNN